MAFLKLQIEVKLSHPLKDTASLFSMGHGIGGGDEEVIYVDDEPSFSDHALEGVIHELLECSGRVTETEEHHRGFEESLVDDT